MKVRIFPLCTKKTWVTRDDKVVAVKDMELSHLSNTIAYLRRNCIYYRAKVSAFYTSKKKRREIWFMSDHDFLSKYVATYPELFKQYVRRYHDESL